MKHLTANVIFTMISFYALVLYFPITVLVLWRRPKIWVQLLTLFLGMLTGLLDLRSDEAQFTVLLLLVFGFFAGFAQPRRAALAAVLLAMWIPIITVAGLLAGVIRGQPFGVPASCLAVVPALIGAYLGAFTRRNAVTGGESLPV